MANIDAVLAHIRNGNANGPGGALSGLAAAIVDAWNKNGLATEEETAALLGALRDRLDGESALIGEAVADTNE